MSLIDVNDTTIYYERIGQGPSMLFVHGMCGHADVWADQAVRLSDRYACVRYDRRGHTRSGRGNADHHHFATRRRCRRPHRRAGLGTLPGGRIEQRGVDRH